MVSADDDMRPYSLMEDSPESLENDEISRGRLHKVGEKRKRLKLHSASEYAFPKPHTRFATGAPNNKLRSVPDNARSNTLVRYFAADNITVGFGPIRRNNAILQRMERVDLHPSPALAAIEVTSL